MRRQAGWMDAGWWMDGRMDGGWMDDGWWVDRRMHACIDDRQKDREMDKYK